MMLHNRLFWKKIKYLKTKINSRWIKYLKYKKYQNHTKKSRIKIHVSYGEWGEAWHVLLIQTRKVDSIKKKKIATVDNII